MKIGKKNRAEYENTHLVVRDGLKIEGGMGKFHLKSLWLKGDLFIAPDTSLCVKNEVVHMGRFGLGRFPTKDNKSFNELFANPLYRCFSMLEELNLINSLNDEKNRVISDAINSQRTPRSRKMASNAMSKALSYKFDCNSTRSLYPFEKCQKAVEGKGQIK